MSCHDTPHNKSRSTTKVNNDALLEEKNSNVIYGLVETR